MSHFIIGLMWLGIALWHVHTKNETAFWGALILNAIWIATA